MNNLLKVFMGLFLSLLLTVPFTACSDDDSDDDGKVDNLVKIENFSVSIVPGSYGNMYQYSWTGVQNAYYYRVFYKMKDTSGEWEETNAYTPNPNNPGQTMTATMMAGYSVDVVYEMKIVAYRDSTGKIIAESETIESEPLPLR